jgi:leucyl aminopeptidase
VASLGFAEIQARGMGGIVGVGQGSARKPRFVHLRYEPAGGAKAHVALVGKGVTFDSGGLSIKPSDGMLTMRCDMAGAAAVIGTMKAIAATRPNVRVDVIFGAVENMPSSNAYKLGDILTMYSGKRVEIHNTDAEGRLVLADCLHYASELKPDVVVDLATLTGAAVVALGDWYSALYSREESTAAGLLAAADRSGEGAWRMPLPDLYRDKIKAEWGETKNTGGRAAGSITAALFLSDFVTSPGLPSWTARSCTSCRAVRARWCARSRAGSPASASRLQRACARVTEGKRGPFASRRAVSSTATTSR